MPLRSGAIYPQHLGEVVQTGFTHLGTVKARGRRDGTCLQPGVQERSYQHIDTHHNGLQYTGNLHQQVNLGELPTFGHSCAGRLIISFYTP